uniref:Uncharacterized protein n=1 Tax=Caenorhabditis japonica TaxID=281687 RepID=A0A8R1EEI1_CAEJA
MAPTKPTSKPTLPSDPPTAMPMDQSGPLELDDVPNQNLGSLELAISLQQAESEALELVNKHPALSSTSSVRLNNITILCGHITKRGLPGLAGQMVKLVEVIEKMLGTTQKMGKSKKVPNHVLEQTDPYEETDNTTNTKLRSERSRSPHFVNNDQQKYSNTQSFTKEDAQLMFTECFNKFEHQTEKRFQTVLTSMDNKMSRITEAQSYLHQSLEAKNENMQMMQENFEQLNIKEQEMHTVAASRVAPDQESGTTKGDSKELITSDQLSPESYADLRQNLEMVYNRTGDRKNQLLDNYRKLPFHQTDNDMMDKDVMKHVCLANSLERLQFSMDNTLVINTFIEKLPSQIMRMVIKKNQRNPHHSPSFMETVKLVRTLISENRSVEEAEKRRKETTQINEVCTAEVNKLSTTRDKIPHHHSDGKKSYGHDQLAQRQPSPFATYRLAPCIFCAKDHESFKCTISTQEKVEAINKQKDICRNCLFRNHRTDKCKSRFACPTCKRKHHSSLCLEKSKMDTLVNLLISNRHENSTQITVYNRHNIR